MAREGTQRNAIRRNSLEALPRVLALGDVSEIRSGASLCRQALSGTLVRDRGAHGWLME